MDCVLGWSMLCCLGGLEAMLSVSIMHHLLLCRSKDLLMRVVAMNMSPELTLVDKVVPCSMCFWCSY